MRTPITITPHSLASRFIGMKESVGPTAHNPAVVAMLQLEAPSIRDDETPWCSAFVNYVAWLCGPPVLRSKSLAARSWLWTGEPVLLDQAQRGFHVVVFQRGEGVQPGAEVRYPDGGAGWSYPSGHVALFDHWNASGDPVVLGGNQGNAVSLSPYPRSRILGIREI